MLINIGYSLYEVEPGQIIRCDTSGRLLEINSTREKIDGTKVWQVREDGGLTNINRD